MEKWSDVFKDAFRLVLIIFLIMTCVFSCSFIFKPQPSSICVRDLPKEATAEQIMRCIELLKSKP